MVGQRTYSDTLMHWGTWYVDTVQSLLPKLSNYVAVDPYWHYSHVTNKREKNHVMYGM